MWELCVIGSVKLLLEMDLVRSPGRTSIEAVSVLEKNQFRGAVMQAAEACIHKAKEL